MSKARIWLLGLMVLLQGMPAHAGLDGAALRLLQQHPPSLRWDNVESSPWWVAGVRPRYKFHLGMHVVSLGRGDSTTVLVPARAMLRITRPKGELHAAALLAQLADTPGLFQDVSLVAGSDGHSLILNPQRAHSVLVRLIARKSITDLALFISRYEPNGWSLHYRDQVALDGAKRVGIRRADQRGSRQFWLVAPGQPASAQLTGPVRVALQHRLIYGAQAQQLHQDYRIRLLLDGKPWRTLQVETSLETVQPIYVGSAWLAGGGAQALGQLETDFLELPPGQHELRFKVSAPLYVRLLALDEPDHLLPELNAAPAVQHQAPADAWNMDAKIWRQSLTSEDPARVEAAAQRLAMDNQQLDGGLIAAQAMRRQAVKHPAWDALSHRAELMRKRHTFYRALRPHRPQGAVAQTFLRFVPRTLADPTRTQQAQWFPPSLWRAGLSDIAGASFARLDDALEYAVPPRAAASWLRIACWQPDHASVDFWLQMEQQPPVRLHGCGASRLTVRFRPARADAAMARLASLFGKQRASTLDGPYASADEPAAMVDAATLELELPAKVHRIRVWRKGGGKPPVWVALQYRASAPHRLSEQAYLALLREEGRSRAFALFRRQLAGGEGSAGSRKRYAVQAGMYHHRESAMRQMRRLRRAGLSPRIVNAAPEASSMRILVGDYSDLTSARRARQMLRQRLGLADAFVVELTGRADHRAPVQEDPLAASLRNEWQPMMRLLRSEQQRLTVATDATCAMLLHHVTLSAEQRRQLLREAQEAEGAHDWLKALGAWEQLASGSKGEIRRQAQLARLRALERLGETAMAWRLRRMLFLYSSDDALRWQVWGELKRRAMDEGRMRAMLPLVVGATLRHGKDRDYRELAEALAYAGEPGMSLRLAMLLPDEARPWPAIALAAYQTGWRRVLQQAMGHLPAVKQHLWQGYLAQSEGRYEEAIRAWQEAGEQGIALAEALRDGMRIREKLDSPVRRQRQQAVRAWMQWSARVPGPRQWREAASAVVSSAGIETVGNTVRGTVFFAARSEAGKPVRLRFVGPVDLRLQVRPLHPLKEQHVLDDWVILREQGRLSPVPIIRNVPVPVLKVVGGDRLAGRSVSIERHFGPGVHEITVEPEHGPLLVRVFERRSALLLSVLPPLSPQTLAAALSGRWETHALPNEQVVASSFKAEHYPKVVAALLGERKFEDLLRLSPDEDAQSVIEYMQALVWIKEHAPKHAQHALAKGEALFARHSDLSALSSLHTRLLSGSVWTPQRMVENSAGVQRIELRGWHPESRRQRVRRMLMPPRSPAEVVLPGFRQARVVMDNVHASNLWLRLGMIDLRLIEPEPMQAVYRVDENRPQTLMLQPGKPAQWLRLRLPAGRHVVTIALRDAPPDQYLSLKAYEQRGKGKKRPITLTFERTYYAATAAEPVVLNVRGPLWLRIETREGSQSHMAYRLIQPGWHRLRFQSGHGRKVAYRFFGRQLDTGALARNRQPRKLPPPPVVHAQPEPLLRFEPMPQPVRYALQDDFTLGGQEDGTWSVGLFGRRRLNAAVDRLRGAPVSSFTELDVWHRYFDATHHSYFRSQGLVRWRRSNDLVLGLTERVYLNDVALPASLRLDASLYGERFSGLDPVLNPGMPKTAWSGTLQLTALRRQYLSPKWYHVPVVTGFVRHVSLSGVSRVLGNGAVVLDPPPGMAGRIDTDVYTTYKQQHRYGIGVAETIAYRPWLDTLLRVSVGWRGNEQLLDTDHYSARVGWDQRLGDGQLDLGYTWTHYVADRDRLHASNVRHLDVGLMWDVWQKNQTRWELRFDFRHYWTQIQENVGMIGLTVHFGKGRMYRDFMPGELDIPDFLELRQRRIPQAFDNRVEGIAP